MGKFEPLTCQAALALGNGILSFYFYGLYAAMQHEAAARASFRGTKDQTQINEIMRLLKDPVGGC